MQRCDIETQRCKVEVLVVTRLKRPLGIKVRTQRVDFGCHTDSQVCGYNNERKRARGEGDEAAANRTSRLILHFNYIVQRIRPDVCAQMEAAQDDVRLCRCYRGAG